MQIVSAMSALGGKANMTRTTDGQIPCIGPIAEQMCCDAGAIDRPTGALNYTLV